MPYIKANDGRRASLRIGDVAKNAGELNYQIFYYTKHLPDFHHSIDYKSAIKIFVDNFLCADGKPNYQKWNDMTGALIRCSIEIYRRLPNYVWEVASYLPDLMRSYDKQIADYEDEKIISNGDVE